MKWKDGLDDWLKDNEPENHARYREEWANHWTNAVNDFQNFTVPLVQELPSVKDSDHRGSRLVASAASSRSLIRPASIFRFMTC